MDPIEMDGFIGCSVAAESIMDATTILHGPGGCRIHLSRLSSRYMKRGFKFREGDYFFHFDRVPCTFIDRDDYIYGASKKVAMILEMLEQDNTKFATVIQSPGASLIGDKLKDEVINKGLQNKTLVMDTSFMSEKFSTGFDVTMTQILEKVVCPGERRRMTANIIGLPFTCRGYYNFLNELKTMLSRMGIEVIAAIGAGCTLDELARSSSAEFNICIYPEYCARQADLYERMFSIPTIRGPDGVPFGYYSMRSFISSIAERFGTDPGEVLSNIADDEHIVELTVEASLNVGELLNYKTFSVMGEASMLYPIADFMIRYFRMMPKCLKITEHDPVFDEKIRELVEKINSPEVLEEEFADEYTNVLFGPGSYVKLLQSQDQCGVGIDINLPPKDMIDIAPKSTMGLEGLHMVLDQIYNSR